MGHFEINIYKSKTKVFCTKAHQDVKQLNTCSGFWDGHPYPNVPVSLTPQRFLNIWWGWSHIVVNYMVFVSRRIIFLNSSMCFWSFVAEQVWGAIEISSFTKVFLAVRMQITNFQWKNNVFTITCDSRLVVGMVGHGLARQLFVHSINIVHRGGPAAKRFINPINLLIAWWGYSYII